MYFIVFYSRTPPVFSILGRDASQHADSQGFLNYSGALQAGNDIRVENHTTVAAAKAQCAADAACEGITFNNNASEKTKRVYFKTGITLNADKAWSSLVKATHAPRMLNTGGP